MDDESVQLMAQWEAGDERAAEAIFERYVARLVALAGAQLSAKMQRRIDPEDVVQSVYRSFFRHARAGRYELKRGGDLWRLLAAITVNKLRGQVEFQRAGKRSIDREKDLFDDASLGIRPEAVAREPSAEEAIAVAEELEFLMQALEPLHRQILELRLQGESVEEIATRTARTERTVRRVVEGFRDALQQRLRGSMAD